MNNNDIELIQPFQSLKLLYTNSTTGLQQTGVYDYNSSNGKWSLAKSQDLASIIELEINNLKKTTTQKQDFFIICSKKIANVLATTTHVHCVYNQDSFSKKLYNAKFGFMFNFFITGYIIDELDCCIEFEDHIIIGGTDGLNTLMPNNPYLVSFKVININ